MFKLFIFSLTFFLTTQTQLKTKILEEEHIEPSLISIQSHFLISCLEVLFKKIIESNVFSFEDERVIYFLIRRLIEFKAISKRDTRILIQLLRIAYAMRRKLEKTVVENGKTFKRLKYGKVKFMEKKM